MFHFFTKHTNVLGGHHVQHSYPVLVARRGQGRRLPPTPCKPSTLQLKPTNINFPKLNASPTHVRSAREPQLIGDRYVFTNVHSHSVFCCYFSRLTIILRPVVFTRCHHMHEAISCVIRRTFTMAVVAAGNGNGNGCVCATTIIGMSIGIGNGSCSNEKEIGSGN